MLVSSQARISLAAQCFKRQMERFIDFGDGPGQAMMLNNADWLLGLNYVDKFVVKCHDQFSFIFYNISMSFYD